MTNKPNTDKTIEQIKNEGAANHSSVYTNNDFRIRAAVGFECGFDAAIKLCEQRERDLVEALKFSHMTINHALALGYVGEGSTNGMFKDALKCADLALKKHRGENDSKD